MNRQPKSVSGYDRLAPVYRSLERVMFRDKLQRARVALLDDLPHADRALLLGDGDGRLLEQICLSQPRVRITSVDQSQAMLRRQQERVRNAESSHRVTLECCDARDLRPQKGQFDLLVTAFFLDCFSPEELPSLLEGWLCGVRSGGLLYFVDFAHPQAGWPRLRASVYLNLMHRFFRWQTALTNRHLPNFTEILEARGLTLMSTCVQDHGLLVSSIYHVP